jgi:hypothetical protein
MGTLVACGIPDASTLSRQLRGVFNLINDLEQFHRVQRNINLNLTGRRYT